MFLDLNSTKNLFQLFAEVKKLPFAASRHHWTDHDLVVVTRIVPRGKYGHASDFQFEMVHPTTISIMPHVGESRWKFLMSVVTNGDLLKFPTNDSQN